jgi:hypothetical protein
MSSFSFSTAVVNQPSCPGGYDAAVEVVATARKDPTLKHREAAAQGAGCNLNEAVDFNQLPTRRDLEALLAEEAPI